MKDESTGTGRRRTPTGSDRASAVEAARRELEGGDSLKKVQTNVAIDEDVSLRMETYLSERKVKKGPFVTKAIALFLSDLGY